MPTAAISAFFRNALTVIEPGFKDSGTDSSYPKVTLGFHLNGHWIHQAGQWDGTTQADLQEIGQELQKISGIQVILGGIAASAPELSGITITPPSREISKGGYSNTVEMRVDYLLDVLEAIGTQFRMSLLQLTPLVRFPASVMLADGTTRTDTELYEAMDHMVETRLMEHMEAGLHGGAVNAQGGPGFLPDGNGWANAEDQRRRTPQSSTARIN